MNRMSFYETAEEMFEELEYDRIQAGSVIIYTNHKTLRSILFFLQSGKVAFQYNLDDEEIEFKRSCDVLTPAELKAVAVQLHALGWI